MFTSNRNEGFPGDDYWCDVGKVHDNGLSAEDGRVKSGTTARSEMA